jgi:hypothetical protein
MIYLPIFFFHDQEIPLNIVDEKNTPAVKAGGKYKSILFYFMIFARVQSQMQPYISLKFAIDPLTSMPGIRLRSLRV